MCSPAFAVQAAVAGLTIAQQTAQASAQKKFQDAQYRLNRDEAARAAEDSYGGFLDNAIQSRQAAAEDIARAGRDARRAVSTATAGAASAGISGDVVNSVQLAIQTQSADFQAVRQRNLRWDEDQLQRSLRAVRASQEGRTRAGIGGPIQGPDYLGILGGLVSAGVDEYSGYLARQKLTTDRTVKQ